MFFYCHKLYNLLECFYFKDVQVQNYRSQCVVLVERPFLWYRNLRDEQGDDMVIIGEGKFKHYIKELKVCLFFKGRLLG